MNPKALLTTLCLALATLGATALPTTPFPTDLQLVPPDALPARATYWSVTRWNKFPGSPVNWCRGRTDVLYYRSPSFGTNKIIIDDTLTDGTQTAQATTLAAQMDNSNTPAPLAPFGPNDIWLEIQFHTNSVNLVDVILHGAINWSVWKLLSKTDLTTTNAWTLREIQINDGTTNTLYFGPFPDDNPTVNFFRAESFTNLFIVVATNLPSPVGIDYHSPSDSMILAINYGENNPTFGILDTNASLTQWSGLGYVESGYEVRLATVKTTMNGFTNGDLFYSSTGGTISTPATVGWLSADGTASNTAWASLDDPNYVEDLYIDQTGVWSNDLLVVCATDDAKPVQQFNAWRIHSPTEIHLVTTNLRAAHLEGLLTLPNDERYGPWAGKLLTADQNTHAVFAVATNGIVTTNYLGIDADGIYLIPTNQDLYCVAYQGPTSRLLKVPRQFFNRYWGDILMEESNETGIDASLRIVHWNGTGFEIHTIDLYTYFPQSQVDIGFFERSAFAPIDLPPDP